LTEKEDIEAGAGGIKGPEGAGAGVAGAEIEVVEGAGADGKIICKLHIIYIYYKCLKRIKAYRGRSKK
jgi:hypothetical protein